MTRFHGHKLCSVPDLAGESLEFTRHLEEHVGEENEEPRPVFDYSSLSSSTGSTMNSNALIVSIARRIVGSDTG